MAAGKGHNGHTPARLKERYQAEILPQLVERFGYTSPMQAPRLQKITLNMGVGEAKQNTSLLDNASEQLGVIAGQKPQLRRARKSIANFKLREGMPVGVRVTLRSERMYELFDRLMSIALPRVRDFRGLNPRSFDGRGNYSLGIKEQLIFPEIDYDSIDAVRGLDVTITTSAETDEEAYELLAAFGMPFRRGWKPGGAEEPELDPEEQRRVEEARQRQEAEAAAREALRAEQPQKVEEAEEGEEGEEGASAPAEGGGEGAAAPGAGGESPEPRIGKSTPA